MFGDAIDKLFVLIGAKSDMAQDLKKPEKDIEGFERKVEHAGDKMDSHMGASFAKIAKYGALAFTALGVGVGILGSKMLSGAGDVESFRAILETVTGSAEVAGEKLDWLREFATKTPFELPGLMEAAVKLEAYGFAAEDYMGVLGDTAAALGKDVGDAVEALADATMGEFERLKEFGIKATTEGSQIAFNYVDKNGQQQKTLVDKNNQEMIASTLSAIWNERYGGAMEKMSTTWNGMISNLKDAFTTGLADAGADIMPTMKPFLDELIGFVGGDTFKGVLGDLAGVFVDIATLGMDAFTKLAESPLIGVLTDLFSEIVDAFGPIAVEAIGRFGDILGTIGQKIIDSGIVESLARIADAFSGAFLNVIESLAPPFVTIADAFLRMAVPIIEIADKAGILEALIIIWAASKTVSAISSIATSFGTMAVSAAGVAGLGPGMAGIGTAAGTTAPLLTSILGSLSGIMAMAGIGVVAVGIYAIADAAKGYFEASEKSMLAFAKEAEQVDKAWKGLTAESGAAINEFFNNMGIAEENSMLTIEEGFNQLVSKAIIAGNELNTIPPLITAAFQSEVPKIAEQGASSMRLYLQKIAEAGGEAPEKSGLISAQLLAGLQSGDPAIQAAAMTTIQSYLQTLVDNGTMTPDQKTAIEQSLESTLGIDLYGVGYAVGKSYVAGLLASVPGSFIGSGGQVMVHSPGGGGNLVLHQGGLIMHQGGWVTAHAGMLAMNEVPAILQRGEFVTKASSVTPQTLPILQAINTGGAAGVAGVTFTNNTFNLPGIRDSREFEAWAVRKTQLATMEAVTHG